MVTLAHVTHSEVSFMTALALVALGVGIVVGLQLAYKGLRRWRSKR